MGRLVLKLKQRLEEKAKEALKLAQDSLHEKQSSLAVVSIHGVGVKKKSILGGET